MLNSTKLNGTTLNFLKGQHPSLTPQTLTTTVTRLSVKTQYVGITGTALYSSKLKAAKFLSCKKN